MDIFNTLRKHEGETKLDALLNAAKKTGVPHVVEIDIPLELQESMKCQFGVDLFVDNPWTTVPKDIIIKDIKENRKYSAFYPYAGQINASPDPEIILGCNGTDPYAPYTYYVAITNEARQAILQDLKNLHLLLVKQVDKASTKTPGPWTGFGSENEIGNDEPKYSRPLISLEYIGRKADRFKLRSLDIVHPDDPPIMYTSLTGEDEPEIEYIMAVTTHKAAQIGAYVKVNASVQTAPQIPMNASSQFNPEIDAEEKEKWLQEQKPIDEDLLKESFAKTFERMNTELAYNAQFDLYVDDYEELAKFGQLVDLLPSADYIHHATFFNAVTDKEYFITSTAWSTSLCGVVAIAYGQNVLCKVDEITSDSDEENYKPKPSKPEEYTPKFNRDILLNDVKLAGQWKSRAGKIKEFGDDDEDLTMFNIATSSLNFIGRAQKLREQELMLDREFEETVPELEDFRFVEDFDYEVYNENEYNPDENLFAKFELLPATSIAEEVDAVSLPQKFEDRLKQHTPKDAVPLSHESKSLNILWDVQNWIFGESLLEMALFMHRRHFHEAVQRIGKLLDIPKIRTFIPYFKVKSSGVKKEVRTKSDRLKTPKSKTKSFTPKPEAKKAAKKKDVATELSDEEFEEEQRIKNIVETEPVNFILIWSLNDVTTPRIRCDSPSEITSLNFCPHNGDLLVGGTLSGQVVLWDLQGKLAKPKETTSYNPLDRQAYKMLLGIEILREILIPIVDDWFNAARLIPTHKLCPLDPAENHRNNLPPPQTPLVRASPSFQLFFNVAGYSILLVLIGSPKADSISCLVVNSSINHRLALKSDDSELTSTIHNRADVSLSLQIDQMKIKVPRSERGVTRRIIRKDTMSWYRDLKAPGRIKLTAISSIEDAHTSKVVHIQWIHPYLEFVNGRYYAISERSSLTSQFLSTSLDGEIKCWDMNSEPQPKPNYYISQKSVVRKNRFPIPDALYAKRSYYSQLNNRWISTYTIASPDKKSDNKQIRGSLLAACIQFSSKTFKYDRSIPKNPKLVDRLTDTVPYKFSPKNREGLTISRNACVGMMTGNVCLMSWLGRERVIEYEERVVPEPSTAEMYDTIHDGPITCIARHAFIKNIALTVGGHIWAIWNLKASKWPIKWKRYYGVLVTCCSFSPLRPSLFRIGRSDGCVEIWDLMLMSHEPKIIIHAAGSMVTGFSSHSIPLPKGLLGICDYKASLTFYYIPWVYQLWKKVELDALTEMVKEEPRRKTKLKEWGEIWRKTHTRNPRAIQQKVAKKGGSHESLVKPSNSTLIKSLVAGRSGFVTVGQSLMQSDLSEEQCRQYFREIYKWYLRRRGNTSRLLTDKDREWYEREESCMIKSLLLNNKIDIKQLQEEMSPLIQDEKKRREKEMRVKEILAQADAIFKDSVAMILGSTQTKPSDLSLKSYDEKKMAISEALRTTELVFGDHSAEFDDEMAERIKASFIDRPSLEDIMAQGEAKRELLNEKIQQDLPIEKDTPKDSLGEEEECVDWMSHEDIYKIKKYSERVENVEELKKQYGENYDPLWDFDSKAYKADQVPFKLPFQEEEQEVVGSRPSGETRYKNQLSAINLDLIADSDQNPVELLLAEEKHGPEFSAKIITKEVITVQKSATKLVGEVSPDSISVGSGRLVHTIVPDNELSLLNLVEQIAEEMAPRGGEVTKKESEGQLTSLIDLSQFIPPKKDALSKGSAESSPDFDGGDTDFGDGEEEEGPEEEEAEKSKEVEDYEELLSKSTEVLLHAKSDTKPAETDAPKQIMSEAAPPQPELHKSEEVTEEKEEHPHGIEPKKPLVEGDANEQPLSEDKSEGKLFEEAHGTVGEQSQGQEEVRETETGESEASLPSSVHDSSRTIQKSADYFEDRGEEEILLESMLLGEEASEGESIASPGPSPSETSSEVSDFIASDESEQEMFDEFFGEAPPSRYVPPIIRKPSTLSVEEPTEEYMGEAEAEPVDEETDEGRSSIPTESHYRKRMSIPEGQRIGTSSSSSSSENESGSIDRTFSQILKDRVMVEVERQRQIKETEKSSALSTVTDK